MTNALYRKSSKEVILIDLEGGKFEDILKRTSLLDVIEEPNFIDGTECRDKNGNLRIDGYSKIVENDLVRNAYPWECSRFEQIEVQDFEDLGSYDAVRFFRSEIRLRKILLVFFDLLLDRIRGLEDWNGEFTKALRETTNLPDFRKRVSELKQVRERDLLYFKVMVENSIGKDF